MNYYNIENAVARYFHLIQQTELRQGKLCQDMRLSLWASPAYWINQDGTEGGMSCDTFTYHFFRKEDEYFCEVEVKLAEAMCRESQQEVEISRMHWDTIQVMKPWQYCQPDPFAHMGYYPDLPRSGIHTKKDYLEIRNLQNMFFEHRLHEEEELFSSSESPVFCADCLDMEGVQGKNQICSNFLKWQEKEKRNNHCYLFLGVTGIPVIEIARDGQTAEGLFMTQIYQVKAGLYYESMEKWKLKRTMALTRSGFCREESGWKISRMEIRNLMVLPEIPYRNDGRYDRCGKSADSWSVDQPFMAIPDSETAMRIENLINGWVYGCRRGELVSYIEKHMKNPLKKNHMLIKSYGAKTPELPDYEAIYEKVEGMVQQYRERYYTFHAPTTPVIQLNEEDGSILGTWFDCAATNLRSMAETPECIPYMAFVNKYVHKFEQIDEKWYLTDFYNEPMISLPDWELDMVNSRGYVNYGDSGVYPSVFEGREGR